MRCRFLAAWIALLALFTARHAAADGNVHLSVDWEKLGELFRRGGTSFLPREAPRPSAGAVERDVHDPLRPTGDTALLNDLVGSSPRLTLVARDWGGSALLVGRLSAADQVRLSRSKRMVMARGLLLDGPVSPFVQIGLGQWRVDPDMVLVAPNQSEEMAAQFGGGIEMAFSPWAALAVAGDCTVLYPDRSELNYTRSQQIWSGFLAARASF